MDSALRSRGSLDARTGYERVRAATERLCAPLSPEDCSVQSMAEASPVKWHLAHTSWFFETFVLARARSAYEPFDPAFAFLFNSYYDAVGERVARDRRGLLSRPSLEAVYRYRAHVDRAIGELASASGGLGDLAPVLELGLHHEQQHQELILTDLKHHFWCNPLHPAYLDLGRPRAPAARRSEPAAFVRFAEGPRRIGHAGEGFAFDNEAPRHAVLVGAFEIAARPVTNGEYLAFIADQGYARPELWLSDGWDAVRRERWEAPLYWERRGGEWWAFTLGGMRPLDLAEPVCHVSFYEAEAYARWAGARLPREEEWEVAAEEAAVAGNFAEEGRFHPRPVEAGAGAPAGLFGDVWEWTQSAYAPYPGFRAAEGALGEYNGKFMCNQIVLRGGSCASPRSHLRATYRNFFPPAARWQFSGLRLARDV